MNNRTNQTRTKKGQHLMPLKHLRVCEPCGAVRFADCGRSCRLPVATDPESWRQNMQEGAGTMRAGGTL